MIAENLKPIAPENFFDNSSNLGSEAHTQKTRRYLQQNSTGSVFFPCNNLTMAAELNGRPIDASKLNGRPNGKPVSKRQSTTRGLPGIIRSSFSKVARKVSLLDRQNLTSDQLSLTNSYCLQVPGLVYLLRCYFSMPFFNRRSYR